MAAKKNTLTAELPGLEAPILGPTGRVRRIFPEPKPLNGHGPARTAQPATRQLPRTWLIRGKNQPESVPTRMRGVRRCRRGRPITSGLLTSGPNLIDLPCGICGYSPRPEAGRDA